MCRKSESGQECVPLLQANLLPHHLQLPVPLCCSALPAGMELPSPRGAGAPCSSPQQEGGCLLPGIREKAALFLPEKGSQFPSLLPSRQGCCWDPNNCMCLSVIQTPKHSNPEVHNDNLQPTPQVGVSGNFAVMTVRFCTLLFDDHNFQVTFYFLLFTLLFLLQTLIASGNEGGVVCWSCTHFSYRLHLHNVSGGRFRFVAMRNHILFMVLCAHPILYMLRNNDGARGGAPDIRQ